VSAVTKAKTDSTTTKSKSKKAETETLYRTAQGQRVHLRGCPHIAGLEVIPVKAGDTSVPVCRWTRAELDGVGRIPQKTLDGALREFGASPEVRPKLIKLLKGLKWDSVYLPQSRSFVALALENHPVAWAGKTYVQIGEEFVPLPEYQAGVGGGAFVSELWGEPCPECFMQRSMNGTCSCD
jgi:hypothetical protein